jgi:uncharacterized membrane protein
MHSHFILMLSFAFICSVVISLVTKNEPREQFRYFIKFFLSLVLIALAIAWIMYPFPIR